MEADGQERKPGTWKKKLGWILGGLLILLIAAYFVGDMGSSLSAGQKQRVLLARALYREPRILFLDEGTAHLDVENERLINTSLRQLRMTRISIAHRPDIASGADRLVRVFRTVQSLAAEPRLLPDAVDKDTSDGRLAAPA